MEVNAMSDLTSYINSCHSVTAYENIVLEFSKPSFQVKPSWYDDYIARFDMVAVDPIKWSNLIVPQFISVPQKVISSVAQVKSHFDAIDDDCTDLSDQDAINDARRQLQAIIQVVTTVIGACSSLISDLQRYASITEGEDCPFLQQGVSMSMSQINANAQSMNSLNADMAYLRSHIDSLEDWWPFTAGKINDAKKKLGADEAEYAALQHDQPVLQSMNASLQTILNCNKQACSGFGNILNQWMTFYANLQDLQQELNNTMEFLTNDSPVVSIWTDESKRLWDDLVSMAKDLAGVSYT
jgi:hypothetical protein